MDYMLVCALSISLVTFLFYFKHYTLLYKPDSINVTPVNIYFYNFLLSDLEMKKVIINKFPRDT